MLNTLAAEPGYHNCSPMVRIIDHAIEGCGCDEGVEMIALMDNGSQISVLTKGYCTEFGLRILLLKVCCISRGSGVPVSYKGYTEVNLTISDLPRYNEDTLVLVVPVSPIWGEGTCSNRYPGHRPFGCAYN